MVTTGSWCLLYMLCTCWFIVWCWLCSFLRRIHRVKIIARGIWRDERNQYPNPHGFIAVIPCKYFEWSQSQYAKEYVRAKTSFIFVCHLLSKPEFFFSKDLAKKKYIGICQCGFFWLIYLKDFLCDWNTICWQVWKLPFVNANMLSLSKSSF